MGTAIVIMPSDYLNLIKDYFVQICFSLLDIMDLRRLRDPQGTILYS
jgi:hypothetical protein